MRFPPWNRGVWQIDFEEGRVSVKPSQREPQVTIQIHGLSQAFFGTPALDVVRAHQHLQVDDERGYEALRDLLAGPPMWSTGD